jgi:hypothetical protein
MAAGMVMTAPRIAGGTLDAHAYRVLIGNHVTKQVLAEMPASDLQYTDELNKPGSCSFRVPLEHEAVTADVIWPGRRTLFIERDGQVVWGGWIMTARASGASLEVGAEGWWAILRRRFRLGPWRWVNHDQVAIAVSITNLLLAQDADALPAVTYDTLDTGTIRSYEWLGHDKPAAAALDELAAMAGGFDWSMRYAWTNLWPAPNLHFHYPWRGRRVPLPIDDALPLTEFGVAVDATPVACSIAVFGRDNPDFPDAPWTGRWAIARSDARELGFPELHSVEAARDVESLAELQALADRRMRTTSDCSMVPSVTYASGGDVGELDNLEAGDVVHVVHHRGWLDIDGWFRIMGRSVAVGEDGTERTTLDLAPYALAGGPA